MYTVCTHMFIFTFVYAHVFVCTRLCEYAHVCKKEAQEGVWPGRAVTPHVRVEC